MSCLGSPSGVLLLSATPPSCARAGPHQDKRYVPRSPAYPRLRFIRNLLSVALRFIASPPQAKGQREHVLVELTAREVVGKFGVRVCAVHPARVRERHLLVAQPVALEDELRAHDVEALLRVARVRGHAIEARREREPREPPPRDLRAEL